ncbi:MAG: hypothetical protein U5K32_03490 [Bacteroidales bacterium]|nr:hypothetical protein [Bacteroidales bacterium]
MMKFLRYFIISLFAVVLLPGSYGQEVPYGINYQAVARDSYGNELTNQSIDIRFTVLSSTPLGTVEYQEVHYDVSTSRYGVFSVVIGKGTPIMGVCESFADIDWKTAAHYLRVEIKFSNEFLEMGTMQFLSVPYALYAQKSLEPGPEGPKGEKGDPGDPASDDQKLSFDGSNLSIDGEDGGNTVNMGSLIQSLSLKGDTLSISRGNFVTFAKLDVNDDDADPTNEIQDLRLENDELRITEHDDPSLIDLSVYLDNTDMQELVFNTADSSLVISGGNSISLADLLHDADNDEFNEIQNLALDGNILTITMNGGATAIDLGPYLDNTDEQELAYDPVTHELTITSGTAAVSLEGLKDDADADATNELITSVAIEGTELVINEGLNEGRVDLSANIIAFRALKETNTNAAMPLSNVDFIPDVEVYNEGSDFNMATGEFTVAYDGIYTFNITYSADGSGSARELMIYLNGNLYENLGVNISSGDILYRSVTMKLNYQDKVKIVIHTGSGTSIGTGSFSGYKVY